MNYNTGTTPAGPAYHLEAGPWPPARWCWHGLLLPLPAAVPRRPFLRTCPLAAVSTAVPPAMRAPATAAVAFTCPAFVTARAAAAAAVSPLRPAFARSLVSSAALR